MNTEDKKYLVLKNIANGHAISYVGRAKVRIKGQVIHVRFNSTSSDRPHHYPFNINKNTLTADWELWICGNKGYYLLPMIIIRDIYDDPDHYDDYTHLNQRIHTVSVNYNYDTVTFAKSGKKIDISKYKNKIY